MALGGTLLVVAVLAGLVVWWLSPAPALDRRRLRTPRDNRIAGADGGSELDKPLPPSDTFAYNPYSGEAHPVRRRLRGLIGIVVLILLSSATIALALWQLGHFINEQFARYVNVK